MKRVARLIYSRFHAKILIDYHAELEKAVGECKTLLDIGCGPSSPIKPFSKRVFCVGIDASHASIEKSRKDEIHNKYYEIDALDIEREFKANSFDCVLASDLIEHLTREEGLKLLHMMGKIARRRVIIFTPNGFLPQREYDNNPRQIHKSGWTAKEMRGRGYKVIGINGWKSLRGECAYIKFRPGWFWGIISALTGFFVKNYPEKAFQLLCIKDKGRTLNSNL